MWQAALRHGHALVWVIAWLVFACVLGLLLALSRCMWIWVDHLYTGTYGYDWASPFTRWFEVGFAIAVVLWPVATMAVLLTPVEPAGDGHVEVRREPDGVTGS